jgi:hypothetical protein
MDAVLTLGIALGLMAVLVFGFVLIVFLMLVGTVFSLVMASVPARARATPVWQTPRMIRAAPLPPRRRVDWGREEIAA